jgi:hypothetical protein
MGDWADTSQPLHRGIVAAYPIPDVRHSIDQILDRLELPRLLSKVMQPVI